MIFFLWPILDVSDKRARDTEPAFTADLILDSDSVYLLKPLNICEVALGCQDFARCWEG